jgi:hypothetical protein
LFSSAVGFFTYCTTTADDEKAIEILQNVKIKLVDKIKRYAILQLLAFLIETIFEISWNVKVSETQNLFHFPGNNEMNYY